jgi:hypothetical protein
MKTYRFSIRNASENSLHKIYKIINNQYISRDVIVNDLPITVRIKWVLSDNLQEYITDTEYFTLDIMKQYTELLGRDLSVLLNKSKLTFSIKQEQKEDEQKEDEHEEEENQTNPPAIEIKVSEKRKKKEHHDRQQERLIELPKEQEKRIERPREQERYKQDIQQESENTCKRDKRKKNIN